MIVHVRASEAAVELRRPSSKSSTGCGGHHHKMKIDLCCCICRVGPFTRAEVNDIYAPTNSANYGSDQRMTDVSPLLASARPPVTPQLQFGPMSIRPAAKSALLVSLVPDSVSAMYESQLWQYHWQTTTARSLDEALASVQTHRPFLVLIDARKHKHNPDPLQLVRKVLEANHENDDIVYVAVTDKNIDEKTLNAILESGVAQIASATSCSVGENLRLLDTVWRLQVRVRAAAAMFQALDSIDTPVQITDQQHSIQYVNRAFEAYSSCSRHDLQQKPCAANQAVSSARRSSHAKVAAVTIAVEHQPPCPCVPVNHIDQTEPSASSSSAQYVFVRADVPNGTVSRRQSGAHLSSCDRQSLKDARRHPPNTAMADAPIIEIMSLLRESLTLCNTNTDESADIIQRPIKEAMRILSTSDLYQPSINKWKDQHDNQIVTDFLDGLVQETYQPPVWKDRKKSVSEAMRLMKRQSVTHAVKECTAEIEAHLQASDSWQFDVLELERMSLKKPLYYLGLKIFDKWKVCEYLRCDMGRMKRWLHAIEQTYHADNPYHNATHAADVLHATAFYLANDIVAQDVEYHYAVAALIAAVIHDLDHPGYGNAFLVNSKHTLAVLYNDLSVLENHHVALAFQMMSNQQNINILSNLDPSEYQALRKAVIDIVLATDMRKHFVYLTKFQQCILNADVALAETESNDTALHQAKEQPPSNNSQIVCRMLIKCADICNPARPWKISREWAFRIVEEYFRQTAEERRLQLPLTMETFDRNTCNVPKTQCGFIDMFARTMFSNWQEYCGTDFLLTQTEQNYERWKAEADVWTVKWNSNFGAVRKSV